MAAAAIEDFLRLAAQLADESGEIILRYFRSDLAVHDKADLSPVTIADREAETAMRRRIETHFPDHGIIGEEHGAKNPGAPYVWVLDPIDGTKSFITGKPLFGTLIALLHEGRAILGVINHPALHERWTGARGSPSLFNGAAAKTRACESLAKAVVYTTSPYMFASAEDAAAYERVRTKAKLALFGTDCYGYGLVASGFADLVVEAGLKLYDYCALIPVLEGAGGVISDWRGLPLGLHSDGRVLAAGDARAHREALRLLSEAGA
ncbi:MAG TPA: histidinol-phosphatase [Alphaproteobacteria bacterium]|nr:histidinol-phosphatase [Alphaproteobacteria bacterium]